MSLILHIETTTTNCSVSLSKDGQTIAIKEDNDKNYSHAERLHVYIDEVLRFANTEAQKLDAISVSKGPGSYTGLRIGVSAAKGLCYALGKPLISVPTLQALARQVHATEGVIIAMLDARRMEVYAAVFDPNNNLIRNTQAQVLDENAFATYLEKGKVYFVGSGVEKTKQLMNHENAVFIDNKFPSAQYMSTLSDYKFKQKDFEDVAYFEPYYLKDFIALKPKSQVGAYQSSLK